MKNQSQLWLTFARLVQPFTDMKYRIREHQFELISELYTNFIPQKKYAFWPFWINLFDNHIFTSLEKAKEAVERNKNHRNKKPVYHEV